MKFAMPFQSRPTRGGEILAPPTTFLPVEPAQSAGTGEISLLKMQLLADFLPVLNFKREKFDGGTTVAKGDLR